MVIGILLTILLVAALYALVFMPPVNAVHRVLQEAVVLTIFGVGVAIMAIWLWYLTSIFLPVPAPPT